MLVLGLHTSSPTLGIAVVRDESLVGETIVLANHQHLEHTVPAIRDLMLALGIDLKSVDGFGVALGPGSFSGVRVGLASVKGLAMVLNKPVSGICSLEVPAYDLLHEGEVGIVLMDAKRGQTFCAVYRKTPADLATVVSPTLLTSEDVMKIVSETQNPVLIWADKNVPRVDPIADMFDRTPITPSAVTCALLAEKRLERGLQDNLHTLKPIYVRRPDAEERPRQPFKENS